MCHSGFCVSMEYPGREFDWREGYSVGRWRRKQRVREVMATAQMQKTTIAKKEQVDPQWYLVNAEGVTLGRMATQIATILMGKHRAEYTPHVDTGDFVVVTNADKITLSGRKALTKEYQYYTYYNGGRRVVPFAEMFKNKPEQVVSEAVRRMLPKTKLGRHMLSKLKVYRGSEHPHGAQQPQEIEFEL